MAESEKERIDRELIELLNELRVALPGVQVLFAFLLVVPFNQRYAQVTDVQKVTHFVSFLCTAVATVLLIAPSSYHRLRWREHDKERMLRTSNRLAIAGTIFLALAVTGTVFFVTDFIFGAVPTAVTTVSAALLFGWFWYGLPLVRRGVG
jgi:hypothetical protein